MSVFLAIVVLSYSTVGAFVASHRPGNPIGWIFCGTGLFVGLNLCIETYYEYRLFVGITSRPVTTYVAWIFNQLSIPIVILTIVLLLLLFPSGRLPSRPLLTESRLHTRSWWQAVVWLAAVGSTLLALQ
jgi:hypothetical protein